MEDKSNGGKCFCVQKSRNTTGWFDPQYTPNNFNLDTATEKKIVLVSPKVTGVLEAAVSSKNPNVCLLPDFTHSSQKAELTGAFLSWGTLLRKSAAAYLDIKTTELTVGYVVRPKTETEDILPAVYFIESLENGAGSTEKPTYLSGHFFQTESSMISLHKMCISITATLLVMTAFKIIIIKKITVF